MDEEESKGKKHLQYSDKYFQGYWVQLQAKIRRNDDADDILEGYLENPLLSLRKAWDAHHDNPRPAGDNVNNLCNTGESVNALYNYCICACEHFIPGAPMVIHSAIFLQRHHSWKEID